MPYLWMLGGALAFALMGAIAHELGSRCDWQIIAMTRSGLALLFAAVLARSAGARFVFWRPGTLWIRSIAGSISLVCTFFALTRLPVADVLTLTNMFPIWITLLSWPVLREPVAPGVWLTVVSGLIGVALIQQPHLTEGNFASLLAWASSFSTAVAMIGLHRLRSIDPRAVVVHFSGVSLVFCVVSYFLFQHSEMTSVQWSARTVLLLLAVGVSATVGQLLLTKAFVAGSPAKISVVGLSQVVFAMALDMVFWDRSFSPVTLLGMLLVLLSTAWILLGRSS